MTYWEAASWIIGIVLFDHYVCGWIRRTLNTALSATVLRKRTAGCISSTWSSASRLLPTARRSCSAAVRVTLQIYLNDGLWQSPLARPAESLATTPR
jgi:hypothetical protein